MPTLPTYFHRPCWDYYTDDQGAQTTNRNGLQSVWSLSKVETRKDNCHAIAIAAPPCMYLVMWLTGWLLGLFFLRLVTAAWAHNIGLISTKVSEWQKVIYSSRFLKCFCVVNLNHSSTCRSAPTKHLVTPCSWLVKNNITESFVRQHQSEFYFSRVRTSVVAIFKLIDYLYS